MMTCIPTIRHRGAGVALAAIILALAAGLALSAAPAPVQAAQAVPLADDPEMQARLKRLEYELRCLVCQAESIAESHSEFAQDIRREVARMMKEGMSDQEIRQFLVDRYGDFILFRPPVNTTTAMLWLGPLVLFVIGAIVVGAILSRRRRPEADVTLSAEDHRRASSLLGAGEGKGDAGR